MKALLALLIPLGFAGIGWLAAKRSQRPPRDEHEELVALRSMREELMTKAAEHSVLGDDFAVIALGILERKGKPHAR